MRTYGVRRHDVDDIISKAATASRAKEHPLPLTNDELKQILLRAVGG